LAAKDSSPPGTDYAPAGAWMIYGANGYTGELAAREAVARGLRPILAGRNGERVRALAQELGLPARVFALDDATALASELFGVRAVLHCAGPFVRTSAPMVQACLGTGAHYLDITGEIAVFETVLAQGDAARAAGVALLPGVGFDVVPSDCLAARIAARLPDATHLDLAFYSPESTMSRGTQKTMIESLPHAGAVRRNRRIVPVPLAFDAREIDFGPQVGKRWAMTIPWGDVSTAFWSTGIPNIRVYTGASPKRIAQMRRTQPFLRILGWKPVKRLLAAWIDGRPAGPTPELRASGRVYLWGEARNAQGGRVEMRLSTPEAYRLTASSAVAAVAKVLDGAVPPGAWTPSKAFGADFVLGLDGVEAGA
jgi:short subunit dehydrogenase-like uncharacterized protein